MYSRFLVYQTTGDLHRKNVFVLQNLKNKAEVCKKRFKSAETKKPALSCRNLVETTGLEPVTPCMSSKYSNQLSYASIGDEETMVETIGLEPMTPCM